MNAKIDSLLTDSSVFDGDDLARIQEWDVSQGYLKMLQFVEALIYSHGTVVKEAPGRYCMSFSDVPDGKMIVAAMRKNAHFWQTCWYSSTRHYVFVFEIPVRFL